MIFDVVKCVALSVIWTTGFLSNQIVSNFASWLNRRLAISILDLNLRGAAPRFWHVYEFCFYLFNRDVNLLSILSPLAGSIKFLVPQIEGCPNVEWIRYNSENVTKMYGCSDGVH